MVREPALDRIARRIGEVLGQVDYLAEAEIAENVTVRFKRSRDPVKGERPALTIIFVGDRPSNDDTGHNAWEVVRIATFDLQADVRLVPAQDITGLRTVSLLLLAAVSALRAEGGPMLQLVDWIEAGEFDPEERTQVEDGRMTLSLEIMYRVRRDDPGALLAAGENA